MSINSGRIFCDTTIILFCLMILSGCSAKNSRTGTDLLPVSLLSVLNYPEKYSGRKIKVKGYLLNGYLYLTRDSAKITRDIDMAVHITEPSESTDLTSKCNDSYAVIVGTFRSLGSAWQAAKSTIDPVETVHLYGPAVRHCW